MFCHLLSSWVGELAEIPLRFLSQIIAIINNNGKYHSLIVSLFFFAVYIGVNHLWVLFVKGKVIEPRRCWWWRWLLYSLWCWWCIEINWDSPEILMKKPRQMFSHIRGTFNRVMQHLRKPSWLNSWHDLRYLERGSSFLAKLSWLNPSNGTFY